MWVCDDQIWPEESSPPLTKKKTNKSKANSTDIAIFIKLNWQHWGIWWAGSREMGGGGSEVICPPDKMR